MLSVERDGAAGRISRETFQWLRQTIDSYKDRNVIVCTHQPIHDTVTNSWKEWRSIFVYEETGKPYEHGHVTEEQFREVERMLDDARVDLWLCGHAHSGPRDANWSVKRGRTTIINVASITHAYGTGACRSFVIELKSGSKLLAAKSRNHEKNSFEPKFSIDVDLPFEVTLSGWPELLDHNPRVSEG
jgi:3',5'-cyclic AMP phosphodiesterase CpdA